MKPGIELIKEKMDFRMWEGEGVADQETLLKEVSNIDGLISSSGMTVNNELLNKAPKLRFISQYAVGYDNIDIQACNDRGIAVTNTPGVLTGATADLAFTLILMLSRRIIDSRNFLKEGRWARGPFPHLGFDLAGSTLGIIGLGRIGQAVVKRGQAFEMKPIYFNPTRKQNIEKDLGIEYCSLENLLIKSDVVSIHCPLVPETRSLLGERELNLMKPTAILINTSRGPVVNEDALYKALSERWISGAGLDVYEVEPVSLNHPLLSLSNLVALPHIGSATIQTREAMSRLAAQNIIDMFEGRQPETVINPVVFEDKNSV